MTATGARSPAAEPPPELVARFKEALERLWPEGGKLGLAVSGGPDSMAMLLLAEKAIPGQFEVATVDHGLRPEAKSECAMVAEVCAARSIACEVLRVEVKEGNVQSEARAARYAAFASWAKDRGLSAIATAHHADDQAETLLMRLNRGSGVAGLAGVRERGRTVTSPVPLIRPLLTFRRTELAEIVAHEAMRPVADPSNADDRFDRVRIRKALSGSDWLDPVAMAASAANLADAAEVLAWAAHREWTERVSTAEGEVRYRRMSLEPWLERVFAMEEPFEKGEERAPRAVALRVIELIMMHFRARPRGSESARLLDRLERGDGGNLGGVLATVEGNEWIFRPEPPRRSS
jgi:tRNA(Ile)-lysidine synthase